PPRARDAIARFDGVNLQSPSPIGPCGWRSSQSHSGVARPNGLTRRCALEGAAAAGEKKHTIALPSPAPPSFRSARRWPGLADGAGFPAERSFRRLGIGGLVREIPVRWLALPERF